MDNQRPRVFVVQQPSIMVNGKWVPKFSLTRARRHGELIFLLEPGNLATEELETIAQNVKHTLLHYQFDTEYDFFLPVGEPLAMILIAKTMLGIGPMSQLRVLKWNTRLKQYDLLVI